MSYLITHWEKFTKLNVFYFCSFVQHVKDGKCVDNEPNFLSIGVADQVKFLKCSDLKVDDNVCE